MYLLSDLCFLCLVRTKNIKSVLSESDDNIVIEEKLECVLSELVNFRPEIPKYICTDCLKGLNYVYKFKQKCLENLISLSDYLEKIAESVTSKNDLSTITEEENEKEQQIEPDNQSVAKLKGNIGKTEESPDNKTKKFVCNICKKHFAQVSHLKDHLFTHSGEKPYQCRICDYKCTRSTSLKRHMQIHTGDKHTCKYCQQAFSTVSYLNKHIRKRHNGEDKSSVSRSIVGSEKKEDEEKVVIKIEPTDIQGDGEIQNELSEEMEVECEPDDALQSEDISNEASDQCPTCHQTFTQPDDLASHTCNPHTVDRPHICEVCDKGFNSMSVLLTHKRTHTDEKPFECDVCHKIFRKVSDLLIHKQRIHNDVRPYTCTECSKPFATSSDLSSHMRSHTGDKPYECAMCDKTFGSMSALVYHKRIHDNLKPYRCSECDRTFTQRGHLTSHMRIHTGEKPYQCELCEYSARMAHHLKEHMKTHASEADKLLSVTSD